MKSSAAVAGTAIMALFVAGGARAEPNATCIELLKRLERQAVINRSYGCNVGEETWRSATAAETPAALRRCAAETRAGLARRADKRAGELEACLFARVERREKSAPVVSQWSVRPGERTNSNSVTTGAAGLRSVGKTPADGGTGGMITLRQGEVRELRDEDTVVLPNRREESARRVRELLARSPAIKPASARPPANVSREFRAGLAWSYGGRIDGMHCVQWEEPSDPHDWYDNYLCSTRDFGFKWSFRGPIQGRGLRCIQVNEPSDPHFWHDNYFCWPRDLNVTFRFSSSGRVRDWGCIAVVEPSDPHTWGDNFLCYRHDAG